MNQRRIDQFFKLLDRSLDARADIILVGASAGSLMGHIRPSLDIDFEIKLKGRTKKREQLAGLIEQVVKKTGIAVNYSEDIGHWSMVSYLDYRKTATRYKTFGKLNIKLIEPHYWTIGKLARYLELDIRDLVKIIRIKKLKPNPLIQIWARAVNSSDLSLELGQFKEHVVDFIKTHAKKLWGKNTDPQSLIKKFENLISS